ncbi:MAG: ParA family protein, partial [Acidobacteria bacterium]|nr:ParA family protein [Acidobacteriota bacterium]
PRSQLAPSSADVLHGRLPMREAVRKTPVAGLDLVTGSVDLASMDLELHQSRQREHCLKAPLAEVEADYDLIFMDCPAGLSLLPSAALAVADAHMVVMTPQFLVLDGLENFLGAVDRIRFRSGSRSQLLGLLLTQVDYRVRITRDYVEQIRNDYGDRVFGVEIRVNVRLAEAPGAGQTIFEFAPQSTGAGAYRLLAEELLLRSH